MLTCLILKKIIKTVELDLHFRDRSYHFLLQTKLMTNFA